MTRAADECAEETIDDLEDRRGSEFSRDFRSGFRQAYRDVWHGGCGATPATPPQKYWKASFRTPEGHARAAEWFRGYELGSEHARHDGLDEFRRIPNPDSYGSHPVSTGGGAHPADVRQQCVRRSCRTGEGALPDSYVVPGGSTIGSGPGHAAAPIGGVVQPPPWPYHPGGVTAPPRDAVSPAPPRDLDSPERPARLPAPDNDR